MFDLLIVNKSKSNRNVVGQSSQPYKETQSIFPSPLAAHNTQAH